MASVVWIVFFACCMSVVGFIGYLAGRDSAERQAQATISDLRRANATARQQLERFSDKNRELVRMLNRKQP